jgi:uncharacterized membrane protein YcfT
MRASVRSHPAIDRPAEPTLHTGRTGERVDWVDYAKGICIILVVMMHSTLGVEKAFGLDEQSSAIGHFIAWARPFRMPDFFLISGLFLARRIDATWPKYLDTKLVHFLYFYLLWMTIQFLFKGYGIYQAKGSSGLAGEYGLAFLEPFGTLWFIYLLPLFFVATKILKSVSPLLVFAAAALLEMLPIHTGWIMLDEFSARYVYFFIGYWLSGLVFTFADRVREQSVWTVLAALSVWALANGAMVFGGLAELPVVSLIMGLVGASAVVAAGVLFARTEVAHVLRYLGQHSIVVYLAFFIFMAAARTVLLKAMPWIGVDVISLIVTAAGIIGPLVLHLFVKKSPMKFLFTRPQAFRLSSTRAGWHSASHEQA